MPDAIMTAPAAMLPVSKIPLVSNASFAVTSKARAARAAAEGARAAYRGRVARAERSFLEARETRAESERSLEDALGSALLIARFKSLRLYPDRIECKGEAIVENESCCWRYRTC